MDSWNQRGTGGELETMVGPARMIEGTFWHLVFVDADGPTMQDLEALPVARFARLVHERMLASHASWPGADGFRLVIAGDPDVGRRRVLLNPAGAPCVFDYEVQERVQEALVAEALPSKVAATGPIADDTPRPVTDALVRLVLRELRSDDVHGDDLVVAGRLGLPHERVLHVLHVAAARGLVRAVPLH